MRYSFIGTAKIAYSLRQQRTEAVMALEIETRDAGERLAARRHFWEQTYLTLLTVRSASPEHKGGTITELAELADRGGPPLSTMGRSLDLRSQGISAHSS